MSSTGRLVIIGGAEDRSDQREILTRFRDLCGGRDSRIAILGTATTLPEEVGDEYLKAFDAIGVGDVFFLPLASREEANDPATLKRLEGVDGVFFTGGDQLRIASIVVEHFRNESPPGARCIAVVGTAGDRRDEDLRELGEIAACYFDEVIIREDNNLRGRPPGELAALVADGVTSRAASGGRAEVVQPVLDEEAAVEAALRRAVPGDVVVLCVEDAARAYEAARRLSDQQQVA